MDKIQPETVESLRIKIFETKYMEWELMKNTNGYKFVNIKKLFLTVIEHIVKKTIKFLACGIYHPYICSSVQHVLHQIAFIL